MGAGIFISHGHANVVEGNFIGMDGTNPRANEFGVAIGPGASHNVIGGSAPDAGNIISGNAAQGVLISGVGANDNTVAGNLIGTDQLGNSVNAPTGYLGNGNGIYVGLSASSNLIGGTAATARNVIAGSDGDGGGILLNAGSVKTTVEGNYIGLGADGNVGLGNDAGGVNIVGSSHNLVSDNVISDNGINGIEVTTYYASAIGGTNAQFNTITGNFIGTDAAGTATLDENSNSLGNVGDGILLLGAQNTTIGGTTTGSGNVIAGTVVPHTPTVSETGSGIVLGGVSDPSLPGSPPTVAFFAPASGNMMEGNFIGTDVTGTVALGNAVDGITFIPGAVDNTVGGTDSSDTYVMPVSVGSVTGLATPAAGNLISGNAGNGVFIDNSHGPASAAASAAPYGIVVEGNFIGTNASGAAPLPNVGNGVEIDNGDNNNTIGGTTPGSGNLISGNIGEGVDLVGTQGLFPAPSTQTSNNVVEGNYIGTNLAGSGLLNGDFYSGNDTTDDSIDGNNATLVSGATYGSGPIGPNQAFSINGGYVQLSGATTVGDANTGARTFAAWVYVPNTNTLPGPGIPILTGGDSTNYDVLGISVSVPGSAAPDHLYLDDSGTVVESTTTVSRNAWNYVAFTYTGSTVTFYINGNFAGSFSATLSSYALSTLTLGGDTFASYPTQFEFGAPGNYGSIANVSLYPSAVSAAAVQAMYTENGQSILNNTNGVELTNEASNNTIGGAVVGAGNLISGNSGNDTGVGVVILGIGTSDNVVEGNLIGTNDAGMAALADYTGVYIGNGASENTIGGTTVGAATSSPAIRLTVWTLSPKAARLPATWWKATSLGLISPAHLPWATRAMAC